MEGISGTEKRDCGAASRVFPEGIEGNFTEKSQIYLPSVLYLILNKILLRSGQLEPFPCRHGLKMCGELFPVALVFAPA